MRLSAASRNAACNGIVDRIDVGSGAGVLEVRTGSAPASADDAATGTLLLTFTFADPAFADSASGTATAASVPRTAVGAADGSAGWARLLDSDGAKVADLTVGTSGTDVEISSVAITVGRTVSLTALTLTVPVA